MKAKNLRIILVAAAAGVLSSACVSSGPLHNKALNPVTELKASGSQPVTLVRNGELTFCIIGDFQKEKESGCGIHPDTGKPISLATFGRNSRMLAARYLQTRFRQATGKTPAIVEASAYDREKYPFAIVVGDCRIVRDLGMAPDKLPQEGFEVRTFDGGVAIAGFDGFMIPGVYDEYEQLCGRIRCNGTENGAYDFAERFLGYRHFYSPVKDDKSTGEIIPEITDLTIEPCAYMDWPRFQQRYRSGNSSSFFGGEYPHPHTFGKAHPDRLKDIFYTDPEGHFFYNPVAYGGNLFDVSNLKLADIFVQDLQDYYRKKGVGTYFGRAWAPNTKYIWFGQTDSGYVIENDITKPYILPDHEGYNKASEFQHARFNKYLAEQIKAKIPGNPTYVVLAYCGYLGAPKTLDRFPDNVQALVCTGTPIFARSKEQMRMFIDVYREWGEKCARKPVPYTYDGGYVPDEFIAKSLRGFYEADFLRQILPWIDGKNYYACHAAGPYFSDYLIRRALWNPEYDVEAGFREYATLLMGEKAAPHIIAFFDLLRDTWENRYLPIHPNSKGCIHGPNYKLWYGQAMSDEIVNELLAHLDAAEKEIAPDSPEMLRFRSMAKEYRDLLPDIIAYRHLTIPSCSVHKAKGEIKIDGRMDEEAWKAAEPLVFRRAFAGGNARIVCPDARILWGDKGIYYGFRSPAPYKTGDALWKGDTLEIFLSPGTSKTCAAQLILDPDNHYEDYWKQHDPPRAHDIKWECKGVQHAAAKTDREWCGEIFIPYESLNVFTMPKAGDIWYGNFISNRNIPYEYSSVSPTLNNNRRIEMYAKITFAE